MTQGILYIATGEQFVEEAKISAKTVTECMPEVPIAMITDVNTDPEIFDSVIHISESDRTFGDQISNLSKTPFTDTIYLDTDIYVDENIDEIFKLLDYFDIAVAHNHDRSRYDVQDVPDAFPEYNTGVMAYRMSEQFEDFLTEWETWYKELSTAETPQNQPAFRKALYRSDLRIATLPPEYNLMVRYPGHAIGTVKLFHGRLVDIDSPGAEMHYDVPAAAEKINSTTEHRVFTQLGGLSIYSNKEDHPIHYIRMVLQRNGISGTVSKVIKRIYNKISQS